MEHLSVELNPENPQVGQDDAALTRSPVSDVDVYKRQTLSGLGIRPSSRGGVAGYPQAGRREKAASDARGIDVRLAELTNLIQWPDHKVGMPQDEVLVNGADARGMTIPGVVTVIPHDKVVTLGDDLSLHLIGHEHIGIGLGEGDAIEPDAPVLDLNGLAGQPDDTLDIPVGTAGVVRDDDFPTLWVPESVGGRCV